MHRQPDRPPCLKAPRSVASAARPRRLRRRHSLAQRPQRAGGTSLTSTKLCIALRDGNEVFDLRQSFHSSQSVECLFQHLSNSASSGLFADALSAASELESAVKPLVSTTLPREPTSTVQAGNVVSHSLQVHQLKRRCACCACEYKCKKQIYLWISPGMVQCYEYREDLEDCRTGWRRGNGRERHESRDTVEMLGYRLEAASRLKPGKSRVWVFISDRSSFQRSSGILRKTSTTEGSNCVPEQRRISARAASKLRAPR